MTGRRILLALALLLASLQPALAHKLKVFATVEGAEVTGYAFFIGGGRPAGASWQVSDAAGAVLYKGTTDAEGGFRWAVPGPADYVVLVDAGDGHAASAVLPAGRFTGAAPAPSLAPASHPAGRTVPADEVQAMVSLAVQHEVAPLLARIEEMDSRMRLTDLVSGLFLILGAAGALLWLTGRRSAR